MSLETIQHHWALLCAGAIAFAALLFIVLRLLHDSARARLGRSAGELRRKEKAARKAGKRVARLRTRLGRLRARGESVVPRRLEEAQGRLEDCVALQKIADDQVLIARNQVREIIVEDFPPKRHEALRRRLLPQDSQSNAPFTMDN